MSNETTENFLRVMSEFRWPDPKPIIYRLYYNEDGSPNCYTMDDLPGKYIEVDRETFIGHLWNVRVVDGALKVIPITKHSSKLVPACDQGTACHPGDVCIVVDKHKKHTLWNLKDYEIS